MGLRIVVLAAMLAALVFAGMAYFQPSLRVSEVVGSGPQRVYLFHGKNQSPDIWKQAPYRSVIVPGVQYVLIAADPPQARHWALGGAIYCHTIRSFVAETEKALSPADSRAIGFSMGGFNAAVSGLPYAAVAPVTDIRNLREWSHLQANDKCKPEPGGLVLYLDGDNRVGSPPFGIKTAGEGHAFTEEQAGMILTHFHGEE